MPPPLVLGSPPPDNYCTVPKARSKICYLFLLVITGSFTLKNVDKRDGYIVSDVLELFVVRSLSVEATQLSTSIRIKRPVMIKGGDQIFKFSVLYETCCF